MQRQSIPLAALSLLLTLLPIPISAQVDEPAPPAKEAPPPRVRPDTEVGRLLNALEEAGKTRAFDDEWALRLKAVIDYGPKGVPDLIEELNATDNDMMLRCLGFSLRAIGDKRAVPALIRAFPKTCIRPGSDMGCKAEDKDLMAFMRKHDLDAEDRSEWYGFGRPVREIGGALNKLTGTKQNEEELYHVFLDGGPSAKRQQRRAFEMCAKRWADWWNKHGKELVDEKEFVALDLKVSNAEPSATFPFSDKVKLGTHHNGYVLRPDSHSKAEHVFYDLDTGRMAAVPAHLRELPADRERDDEIQAWATREGFDLMCVEHKSMDAAKPHYLIRGLGLTAWSIDTSRWGTLEAELKEPNPPMLGPVMGGLLVARDKDTHAMKPEDTAAFFFRTREGTHGALFVGVQVHDTNVVLGKRLEGDPNLDPVSFHKGRRFGYRRVEEGM